MNPPSNLRIVSDDNELSFQETIKPLTSKSSVPHHVYKYTKSITKLGTNIGWTGDELSKMIKEKIAISI